MASIDVIRPLVQLVVTRVSKVGNKGVRWDDQSRIFGGIRTLLGSFSHYQDDLQITKTA